MSRIRIYIADDHAVLRTGLRQLISSRPDMEVVGEAGDGRQAVRQVCELHPDVVVMDLSMPGLGGVPAIEAIRQNCPRTRVLVFTMHQDPAYVRSALAAGAHGYITKQAIEKELLAGIRAVAQGQSWMDASLAEQLQAAAPATRPQSPLSRRERQVLEMLAQGHSNQQIAERICLSVKTVETYRTRLSNKLGLHTRADFVRYGLETGILLPGQQAAPPDDSPL